MVVLHPLGLTTSTTIVSTRLMVLFSILKSVSLSGGTSLKFGLFGIWHSIALNALPKYFSLLNPKLIRSLKWLLMTLLSTTMPHKPVLSKSLLGQSRVSKTFSRPVTIRYKTIPHLLEPELFTKHRTSTLSLSSTLKNITWNHHKLMSHLFLKVWFLYSFWA